MKKRFLSLIIALAMMVGVFTPLLSSAAQTGDNTPAKTEVTKTVTLHKLVMSKEDLGKWDSKALEEKGYNGSQNTDQLKALLKEGHSAHEVAGVYFAVKYNSGTNKGKYVTINETDKENPVYGAAESLDATLDKDVKLLAGKTEEGGIEFNTKGLSGDFLIEEIHEKSSYVGEKGEAITDSKAVPVEITLPLVNDSGVVENAHVYPKNTEDKPQIDKNFSADEAKKYMSETEKTNLDNAIAHKAAFEKAKKLYATTSEDYQKAEKEYTKEDKALIEKWGIDFEANTRGKQTLDKKIGDDVEYTVVTDIPAQTKWAQAYWDDKMTEGLTYNKDLSVKLEILKEDETNKGTYKYSEVTLEKDTDYKVTETNNGFVLNFEKSGLNKLNNKAQSQKVTLKYSAKINNTTVTDVPESNDVTFHYGNTKGKGNTPQPTKPENGNITVTKTMKDDQKWPEKGIQVQLVNANTGENVGQPVTLTSEKNTHTWNDLDAETEYKVVELTTGYDVVYGKGQDNALGQITIDNYKTPNPTPLNPSEPKVVTGGKRFVKTNQDGTERLAGAEFVIKNAEGKFLALKDITATEGEGKALADAKKAYDDAVKAWNDAVKANPDTADDQIKVTIGGKEITGKTAAMDKIAELQTAYETAFKAAKNAYVWLSEEEAKTKLNKYNEGKEEKDQLKEFTDLPNIVKLISDSEGKFEITGLEYGDYKLKEIVPPAGYAKLNDDIDFKVAKGSYNDVAGYKAGEKEPDHIGYKDAKDTTKGQQVVNKKVTIPQTGGIGTVIFTAIGLAIMASAIIAIKKRQATEAR